MRLSPNDSHLFNMQTVVAYGHLSRAALTRPCHGPKWRYGRAHSARRGVRWRRAALYLDAMSKLRRLWRTCASSIPLYGSPISRMPFRFVDRRIWPVLVEGLRLAGLPE